MLERRRYAAGEWDGAMTWGDATGGLNCMTFSRFKDIMRRSGYVPEYFETNIKDGRAAAIMRALQRVRPAREYVTFNVYSSWRRPTEAAS